MPEYNERTYRNLPSDGRWHHFEVKFKEIDLWIAVPKGEFTQQMPIFAQTLIEQQRVMLDNYLLKDKAYLTALTPYKALAHAPAMLKAMESVAQKTGIGPMSAVAGAFAAFVGTGIKQRFGVNEILVENGGDIYADIQHSIDIAVFAGTSPLSQRIGLNIKPEQAPLGICTSAGTVGPSLSFGNADAVMIVCKDTLLADSYATRFANAIHQPEDIPSVMEQIGEIPEIMAAIIVKDDKMAVSGCFELKLWR
ncbi:MAG: UPF0280 family protein [Marinifilaceae bacterium]